MLALADWTRSNWVKLYMYSNKLCHSEQTSTSNSNIDSTELHLPNMSEYDKRQRCSRGFEAIAFSLSDSQSQTKTIGSNLYDKYREYILLYSKTSSLPSFERKMIKNRVSVIRRHYCCLQCSPQIDSDPIHTSALDIVIVVDRMFVMVPVVQASDTRFFFLRSTHCSSSLRSHNESRAAVYALQFSGNSYCPRTLYRLCLHLTP